MGWDEGMRQRKTGGRGAESRGARRKGGARGKGRGPMGRDKRMKGRKTGREKVRSQKGAWRDRGADGPVRSKAKGAGLWGRGKGGEAAKDWTKARGGAIQGRGAR